ncbi:J domain-containing protein [Aquiflexum sp. LQ15W]|uniref:J domain-containing protein n=1 Tax=Cognataquiflexum nitidum TaxID=2922272 RepID=UPI001F13508C|nr:J domain-containing protein [Cognataquiflexum nitidum]MCH6202185.1 J domain-containing protein [Cognataquiflexum nitidum]
MKNYYEILEIDYRASDLEIKKAYRRLAVKYHPDKNFGDDFFTKKIIEIKEAYDLLIDPITRNSYDDDLLIFLNKQSKEEKEKQENKRQYERRTQKEYEERFFYEPFKPFYSFRDRELQETPQIKPIFDLWGNKLDEYLDFFKLPKRIGKMVGAYSDLAVGEEPLTITKKAVRFFKGLLVGLLIGAIIYFIGRPNEVWTIIWFTVPTAIILWFMVAINKFDRTNLFIGINGFAEYQCKENRSNLTIDKEVNFNEITDVYFLHVERKLNFSYQGTDFFYIFLNNENGKVAYNKEGTFDKRNEIQEQPIEINFCRKVEQYWTIYLLDKMEIGLEKNGYILFSLYNNDSNKITPFIKLAIGHITFIKENNQEFTYRFNEIKRVYSKGNQCCPK